MMCARRKLGIATLLAGVCFGQGTFDVASIKPASTAPAGPRAISLTAALSHGRVSFQAVTLLDLIQQAYDLTRDQISGCSGWCDSERFDVIAQAEDPNLTKAQAMVMLQALLAGRFRLSARRETKERAGFALLVGKGGSKLKPSPEGATLGYTSPGYLRIFRAMPMTGLVSFVAGTAHQPVLDRTGLHGAFDFTIDLTPPEGTSGDLFTRLREALEDQMGLKLEPERVVQDTLIIERAERPSAN